MYIDNWTQGTHKWNLHFKFKNKIPWKKISLSGSVDVYSPAKFLSQAKGISCFQTSGTNKIVFN